MPNVPTYPSEKVPLNAREKYYHAMATADPAPEPQNREEWWLKQIADRLDMLDENIAYLQDTVADLPERITALEERVTALEEASPVELPGVPVLVLQSSTPDSEKVFLVTVDDSGEISATEHEESQVPPA